MKRKVKLTNDFLDKLPEPLTDGLEDCLKEAEIDEPVLKRNVTAEDIEVKDESSAVMYVSTRHLDRDQEIIMPGGIDLTQFLKGPHVLWNHNWSEPPLGHDDYVGSDGLGLVARTLFAQTAFAHDIFSLVRDKHLRTSSIGFIPLEYVSADDPKFGELVDQMLKEWPEFTVQTASRLRGVIPRSIKLEHSIVSVPANPEALVLAVSNKSLNLTAKTLDEFGLDVRVGEPPEPDEPEAPPAPSKRLVARLVGRRQASALTKKELARIVQERLDLLRGRI